MILEKNKTDQCPGEKTGTELIQVSLVLLCFTLLLVPDVAFFSFLFFYKLKVKPPPAKRRLAFLGYSLYYGVLKHNPQYLCDMPVYLMSEQEFIR